VPRHLTINLSRLLRDLHALARIGRQPSGGVTRRSFSTEYREAVQWLLNLMTQAGLAARLDAVGNVIGRLGPQRAAAVISGSHIDTVPDGGWLDGAYGVLAGLECARVLREADVDLKHAFEVIALIDEEGAYLSLFGSRAISGALTGAEIGAARDLRGAPLKEAMVRFGLDPARFEEARREPSDLLAYVELHIEQGPVLEQRQVQIGIVEGIVGILVAEYRFTGSADHAGTTPMDARHDALRCAAEFVSACYAQRWTEQAGARFTFGALEVLPGVSNVVPRSARLTQEIRSLDSDVIERLFEASRKLAEEAAGRLHIGLEIRRVAYNEPALMSAPVMEAAEVSCSEAGVSWIHMPSGAGHDAQSFARCCPAGMIFVPSRRGASHRPDEETDERDLAAGANVLLRTVYRLAA
jgi:hydantoinase/carbamoylase family amidase